MTKDKNESSMQLYTGFAKRIINGREADTKENVRPIYGFVTFATKVKTIWNDAELGNPYAIWFLYRISEKINACETKIFSAEKGAKDTFDDGLDIDYRLYKNTGETSYPLNLKAPYSWAVARLIKRFDQHCLVLMKLNALGLVKDNDLYKKMNDINTSVLSLMSEAMLYSSIPVTMKNIEKSEKPYTDASAKMGIIPPVILSGKKKADFLPKIKKNKE